jgi:hypothetical protein
MASCYSFIALAGTVGAIEAQDSGLRFDLHTENGLFSVQTGGSIPTEALVRQATVCIIGWLRSYYHHRQQSQRVVVEAGVIVPTAQVGDGTMVEVISSLILARLAETMPCIRQAVPEVVAFRQEAAKC